MAHSSPEYMRKYMRDRRARKRKYRDMLGSVTGLLAEQYIRVFKMVVEHPSLSVTTAEEEVERFWTACDFFSYQPVGYVLARLLEYVGKKADYSLVKPGLWEVAQWVRAVAECYMNPSLEHEDEVKRRWNEVPVEWQRKVEEKRRKEHEL